MTGVVVDDKAQTVAVPIQNKIFSESEFLSKYKKRFDYPQTSANSEGFEENDLEGAWRYLDQWSLYWKGGSRSNNNNNKHGRLELAHELPNDNRLESYVLQGTLIAPLFPPKSSKQSNKSTNNKTTSTRTTTPLKIRVRIDKLAFLSFDRCSNTRGWWVATQNGDFYRLLEPDATKFPPRSETTENNAATPPPFLHRRTLLALLSNLLDFCFSDPKKTQLFSDQDVYQVLEPYRRKMLELHGMEVLPYIAMLRDDIFNYLLGVHDVLDDKCLFMTTLKVMKPPLKKLDLMDVTIVAELMSNQQPWGLKMPIALPAAPIVQNQEPVPELLLSPPNNKPGSTTIPVRVFSEAEILSEYQRAFDHPKHKSADGYQIDDAIVIHDDAPNTNNNYCDDEDDVPWRLVDQWSLYRKTKENRLERADELPLNNVMTNYVLEGLLVGPPTKSNTTNGEDVLCVRIRLDKMSYVSFDRDKDTRGWWVLAHSGDGKAATAFYRLLEPDMSGLCENAHLDRRAILAFLSGLLDTCFYGSQTKRRANMDAHEALKPYLSRMLEEGVDVLPFLVRFKDAICGYLEGSHGALHGKCRFFKSLKTMQPCPADVSAELLAVVAVAERVSGHKPWGLRVLVNNTMKRERWPSQDYSSLSHSYCSKKQKVEPHSLAYSLPASKPALPNDLMSLEDFKCVLREVERLYGNTMAELEKSSQIRQGNNSNTGCVDMQQAMYGRILPDAAEKLFEILDLGRHDCFVDIGHGIGTLVLQAAYTRGCESRGIELMPGRHDVAVSYTDYAKKYIEKEYTTSGWKRNLQLGNVDLRLGELQAPENSEFLAKPTPLSPSNDHPVGVIKAFCNNFAESMGLRAKKGKDHSPCVDDYIAGLFALMTPGSVLVTLHPLNLIACVDSANEYRQKHGLTEGDNADVSFFSFETIDIGPANQVATWSEGGSCTQPIRAYKYTRLHQPGRESPVFLCLNYRGCQLAMNRTPLPAVKYDQEGRALIGYCACRFEPHKSKPRLGRAVNPRFRDYES